MRRKKRPDKRKCQIKHAKKRAVQRYGLELSRIDVAQIIETIQRNGAQFIERQSNRVTVWSVPFEDRNLKVVYDKMRKSIVTCLPEGFEP